MVDGSEVFPAYDLTAFFKFLASEVSSGDPSVAKDAIG